MPRCLNCNTRLSQRDRFCPACGQPTDTRRYDLRSALRSGRASVLRFDTGLPHTLRVLFVRPWDVVRDMAAGRRARYTPAVKLLVILSFIYIVLGDLLGAEIQGKVKFEQSDVRDMGLFLVYMLKFIDGSVITQYLVLTIPVTIALYLVGRYRFRAPYNLAEYFMATCYFACILMAANILILPLKIHVSHRFSELSQLYLFVLAFLGFGKAYHLGFWRTLKGMGLFGLSLAVTSFVFAVILITIIAVSLAITESGPF